jgi:pimeloyl-ACP methyl ester carboxylesterase
VKRASRRSAAVTTEQWVEHGTLRLRVECWGKGPPILLAHGMWCDAGMFSGMAAHLARDHRVLIPDLRGHGQSTVPGQPWRIADISDDLATIMDQLDCEQVTLAGFSMGGMAAVDFALRYPARVSQLALICSSAAREAPIRRLEITALATLIERVGPPHFLPRATARAAFSAAYQRDNPADFRRWAETVAAMDPPAMVQALRAVAGREDLLGRLGEIRLPTLIVTGSADHVVAPRRSLEMRRRLPRARLVQLQGAGHAAPVERAEEVAGLLRDLAGGILPKIT